MKKSGGKVKESGGKGKEAETEKNLAIRKELAWSAVHLLLYLELECQQMAEQVWSCYTCNKCRYTEHIPGVWQYSRWVACKASMCFMDITSQQGRRPNSELCCSNSYKIGGGQIASFKKHLWTRSHGGANKGKT